MAKQSQAAEYLQTLNPKGYVNNREITNLDGQYLVKGSKNVYIKNGEKVVTSKGYKRTGSAKTLNKGVHSSVDWITNSGIKYNVRGYYGRLDFWYNNDFTLLKGTYAKNARFQFATWWSATELIDVLLFVYGKDTVDEWSGGVAEVASVTANTITKKRYLSGTTFAFNDNGASLDTITDSATGFVTAGFLAGETVVVIGSASNDGEYTITNVTAGTLTLSADDALTTESAGASVSIQETNGTFGQSRFFTTGTRKVTINNQEYVYTGGEGTGTLTGVTPSPVGLVSAGDLAIQTVRTHSPSGLSGLKIDLIGMLNNHIYYGSSTVRQMYISKNTDFKDFTFAAPRSAGDGFELTLDSCPTAIIPDEDQMYIGAREDDFYKIQEILSPDEALINISKLKTAIGQGPISQGSVVNIKNSIAFISFEGTVDTLGRVELIDNPQSTPISFAIKDDLDSYDKTDAHGLFFRKNLYYVLPAEGVMITFDTMNQYWQPPRDVPFGRLAIIKINGVDRLCGHSSSANETYIIDEGENADGAPIMKFAAFGYENFGARFSYKNFDELALEMYVSRSTVLTQGVNYEYRGAVDVREFEVDPADESLIFTPNLDSSLGKVPLGSFPLGSSSEEIEELVKLRIINSTGALDFFERQRYFFSEDIDARFEIIAFGENVRLSENEPVSIRR